MRSVIERIRSPRLREQMAGLVDTLQEYQGNVYYVDGNAGQAGNDGLSWETALSTLAAAITKSNTFIASGKWGWAARNTIFVKGDAIDEDLATGPAKCDVIGVGSCDAQPMARILGTQAFTSLGSCAFHNFEFWDDGASANLTFTTCDGIEFHNCKFTNNIGTGTHAVRWVGATGSEIVIENCIFRPRNTGTRYVTAAISLEQTTLNGLVIRNNIIEGAKGVYINSTNLRQGYIDGNVIIATTLPLDDNSDKVIWTRNMFISDANATVPNNVIDANVKLGAGNYLTDGTVGTILYPVNA